jgi:hypothetical protein
VRVSDAAQADAQAVGDALRAMLAGPAVWVLTGDATAIEAGLAAVPLPTDAVWSPRRAVHGPRR